MMKLDELIRIARDHQTWFETDGRYGKQATINDFDIRVGRSSLSVPVVEDLDRKMAEAVGDQGQYLDMVDWWHPYGRKRSRAGWAIAIAGVDGFVLEAEAGTEAAATLIYARSTIDNYIPNFHNSDEAALADIKRRARAIGQEKLNRILDAHRAWVASDGQDGERADLSDADLSGVDLSGADLWRANMDGANLAGAVLAGADLTAARLRGANMVGADLSGACLVETDFAGANLENAIWGNIPMVEDLDRKMAEVISAESSAQNLSPPGETTLYRAEWTIALAGGPGVALIEERGVIGAASAIYARSTKDYYIPGFFDYDEEEALFDIRRRAGLICLRPL